MTDEEFRYLMQLYKGGGGGVNPNFEPSPIPGANEPLNLPHQAMDVPGNVFPGNSSGAGLTPRIMFPSENSGAGIAPPSLYPGANFDFRGGPNLYAGSPTVPYSPVRPQQYDFSGGPNLFAGSPNVPLVGQMPQGTSPVGGPYFTPSDMYDTPAAPNLPPPPGAGSALTEGEPDFGGFPVGGNSTALTEGEPDFGGFPAGGQSDSGTAFNTEDTGSLALGQEPLGSDWPFYVNEFPSGETIPTAGIVSDNMTGAGASGGAPYGYPGPGIGGPDQAGPWVEHNTTPWYAGRPDMVMSADNSVYGTPPEGGFHPGKMMKDAAGNLVSTAGNILVSAADIAAKFGGSIANAAGTVGQRLAGITPSGYNTNLPGGQYWNAETGGDMGRLASEGAFGHPDPLGPNIQSGLTELGSYPGGRGGYFGSSTSYNPDIFSQLNRFGVGQVGSSSVQAPIGGTAPGSSMMNLSSFGSDAYARRLMEQMGRSYNSSRPFYSSPIRALVGGAPGNVFSPAFLREHPLSFAQPGFIQPSQIVNPAAFGGQPPESAPNQSGRASIHFNPRSPS
jgi:hypothetical protein